MQLPTHTITSMAPMAMDAAAAEGSMAFLTGELEYRDPRLLEPLTSVTWMRDIVAQTGGGYVDRTSNYYVNYATTGANQWGIVGTETNAIPIIQANITKDTFPVWMWANIIRVGLVDQQKMQQVGRSLDQIYDEGLRLNYNKTLDQNVYLGFSNVNSYGLVNNTSVAQSFAPATGTGSSRLWINKTPSQILLDFNNQLNNAWAASNYDLTGMPNHVLLPPLIYSYLVNQPASSSVVVESILSYLEKNNIAKERGIDLKIEPCRQCIGAGLPLTTGGASTQRMVSYVNDIDRVQFNITVPLTRSLTQPSVQEMAYLTAYLSYIGPTKFKYFQCVNYLDGI